MLSLRGVPEPDALRRELTASTLLILLLYFSFTSHLLHDVFSLTSPLLSSLIDLRRVPGVSTGVLSQRWRSGSMPGNRQVAAS